jgi:hypothetical protein
MSKRPTEMHEGSAAFSRFREEMKTILSVPEKNLPAKAKGKPKSRPKNSALPMPTA